MPRSKLNIGKKPAETDMAMAVMAISRELPHGSAMKAAHMLNMAMAGFKYLILNAESDAVRLQACKAVTELPMCQMRMGTIVKTIAQKAQHQHLHLESSPALSHQLAELLVGKNPAALQALEHAESQIVPVKAQQTNANP
jgi:hypothetical protein